MRWLIALVLPLFVPMHNVAAQEVKAVFSSVSSPSTGFPAPQPEPLPQTIRDDAVKDTWELGLGYALVGFRSAPFNATVSGLNTTVGYYFRDHLAAEGSFTSAFGSQSSSSSTAKYIFYGAGIKLSWGNRKLQPFVHALLGGVHMFPQTAFSNNGFAVELGGGLEKRLIQRVWLRFEGDYVRSQLYSSGQNNFQAVVGVNYRF
jgi:Outer membrane protein beta-barrel domain